MSTKLHINLRKAPMELEEGTVFLTDKRSESYCILQHEQRCLAIMRHKGRRQGSITPIKRRNSLVDLLNTDYYWLVENFED